MICQKASLGCYVWLVSFLGFIVRTVQRCSDNFEEESKVCEKIGVIFLLKLSTKNHLQTIVNVFPNSILSKFYEKDLLGSNLI